MRDRVNREFQFLIGSLGAVPKLIRALSLLFQFLIGSLEAIAFVFDFFDLILFQFLIGSLEGKVL